MTKIKICLAFLCVGLFSSCADMEQAMTQLNKDLSKLNNAITQPAKSKTPRECDHCAGSGWVPHYEDMDGQLLRDHADCPKCNGRGKL